MEFQQCYATFSYIAYNKKFSYKKNIENIFRLI